MKKKSLALVLAVMLMTASTGCGSADKTAGADSVSSTGAASDKVEVTMFVWAGANQGVVPMAVAEQYMADHPDVTINVIESSNSEMYSKMVAGKETDPDHPIINFGYFNASITAKGINDDMWLALDETAIPNMAKIPEEYHTDGDLGIIWGISDFGIIYNPELVDTPPVSWNDLWENDSFAGKVGLWDYLLYSYIPPVIELHSELGASYEAPEAAFQYVADHISQVNSLVTSADQLQNLLVSGEATVAPYSLQSAEVWKESGAPIEIVIPQEGTIQFPYYLQVVKGTTDAQKKVCYDMINLLLEADNLTEYANQTGTPVLNVDSKVPEKYADDPLFDLEKRSGISPDWVAMSVHNSEWNDLYERLVKTAIQ